MTGRKHRNARERDGSFREAPDRSQRPYRSDGDAYGPRQRYTQDDRGYGEDDWAQPEPRHAYPAARAEDRGEYGYEGEGHGQREYGSRADFEGGQGYEGDRYGRGSRQGYGSWESERYGEDFRGGRGGREQQGEFLSSSDWNRGGGYPDDYWGRSSGDGRQRGSAGRRQGGEGRGPLPQRGGWRDQDGGGSQEDGGSYYRGYYARRAQPYYTSGGASGMLFSESWSLDGPYSGRGPKGYQRSDEQIVEEVSRRLERDGQIDASEIEVSCNDGVVTLQGKVAERHMKRCAEECIEDVYGVKDVMNHVQVDRDLSSRSGEQGSSRQDEGRGEGSKRMKQERASGQTTR